MLRREMKVRPPPTSPLPPDTKMDLRSFLLDPHPFDNYCPVGPHPHCRRQVKWSRNLRRPSNSIPSPANQQLSLRKFISIKLNEFQNFLKSKQH